MALTVSGLQNNYYLVNNPIFVFIQETLPFDYITLTVGTNRANITPIPFGLIAKRARVDISSHVKTLFPNLNQNSSLLTIQISVVTQRILPSGAHQSVSFWNGTKSFLIGGRRGNESNTTVQPNIYLTPTLKIPYWESYPVTASFLYPAQIDNETSINPSNESLFEKRKEKGCNSTYVKFLNSLGGYSYWLFEGVTDQQKNNNAGIINNSRTIDLGNSFDKELELYSKVPKAFLPLMQDLIISPEIYTYRLGESGVIWDRCISQNNTLEVNPAKNVQEVKIKIKPLNKFNPQTVWQ